MTKNKSLILALTKKNKPLLPTTFRAGMAQAPDNKQGASLILNLAKTNKPLMPRLFRTK